MLVLELDLCRVPPSSEAPAREHAPMSTLRVSSETATAFMCERGAKPLEQYPGAHVPWRCRCLQCRREIRPTYSSVQSGQRPCKYCAGKAVDPDEAARAYARAGAEPLVPYPGANGPWPCQCLNRNCGRKIRPRYRNVQSGQRPCKYCAGKAVDPDEAAEAYARARSRATSAVSGEQRALALSVLTVREEDRT